MATNESENNSRGKPANDSIDELLDGVPADPILPKKRARPMDQAGPPSSKNRRADDNVIALDGTDPRERARLDEDSRRRQSSTFGTMFEAAATRQKIGVGVAMMILVLGVYAFVRHLRKNPTIDIPPATAQSVQDTSNSTLPAATQIALPASAAATAATASASASPAPIATTRHPHLHADGHAVPRSNLAQPAPSTGSSNFSGL